MAVDQWLDQVYGTTGASDDIEKTAQDMMLQKLAEQENIDLSGLSQEELDALAAQVVEDMQGETQEQAPASADQIPAGDEAEAQAKFAEADFLGRVMAHAYTQELKKIAQEEAKEEEKEEEEEEKKEKAPAPPPFMPKKEEGEEEKTAGPLASAIMKLGGSVGGSTKAAAYIEKMAEARAQEIAYVWLKQNGLIE